jgi:hypothetical protein
LLISQCKNTGSVTVLSFFFFFNTKGEKRRERVCEFLERSKPQFLLVSNLLQNKKQEKSRNIYEIIFYALCLNLPSTFFMSTQLNRVTSPRQGLQFAPWPWICTGSTIGHLSIIEALTYEEKSLPMLH